MSRLHIRRAEKKDGKTLLSLIDALADYEKLARPNKAAQTRLLRDAFGKSRRFETFLAFEDGKAMGYALFFETYSSFLARPTFYLEDIFVVPRFRKKGVGLKLFLRCLAEAKRRGCGRIEWMVLDWNRLAIRFYEKLGTTPLRGWIPYRIERARFQSILKRGSRED